MAEDTVNMKIVIIGDGACGKSALLLTYINKEFPKDYIPTVVDNYDVVLSLGTGKKLKLSVVDTAGQEDFKSIRSLSLANTHVVIVCYSCVNKASLDNVRTTWVPEIREADPKPRNCFQAPKKTPFVLVGNKLDMVARSQEVVSQREAEAVCKELDGYAAMQCSALLQSVNSNGNVEQVFKVAIRCGVENMGLLDEPFCLDMCKCTLM